ncbi:mechanosensitive ion channel family protein [Ameyamaea chiangmaiensis]|uniref:Mechanosensitive ion channel family protein n=1 Tax=Ameyamaea chiangmaiensis TaxID=442969 RepID=A0A850PBS4_9PROT|nr:mechanosensitive ion channel family protein [Ameyamaea chiangmaiensis]NVN41398.1 mechanosensitive ion channel family protein [Ameyamaea chiangmaiensis]
MRTDYLHSLTTVREWFGWMPAPVASSLILIGAALVALLLNRVVSDTLLHLPGLRHVPLWRRLLLQLQPVVRIMLMLLAASAALPAATGFSDATLSLIGHLILVGFILAIGVGLIRGFRIVTEIYLERLVGRAGDNRIVARSHQTQIRILRRAIEILVGLITVASALTTFSAVRQFGVSLFASAGAASLIVGLSARPLLTNLVAGIQIAITQPIRMEDLIIINGDWCWVEEINATYVVLRVWDMRRHIVPISFFLENQFENWTHNSEAITGVVFLHLDYQTDMHRVRAILEEVIRTCPLWDGRTLGCQVAATDTDSMRIRIIAGARDALQSWDLGCEIREKMVARLRRECPEALPRARMAVVASDPDSSAWPTDEMISPPIRRPPDVARRPSEAQADPGHGGEPSRFG